MRSSPCVRSIPDDVIHRKLEWGAAMDMILTGARAVVTGGSRGIGQAIVNQLTIEGCRVEYCARHLAAPADVAHVADRVPQGTIVDLENPTDTRTWVTQAVERLGGLDVLVLNASAMASGFSSETWRRNSAIEIDALATIVEIAEPHLKLSAAQRGDAAIVIIGSTSALSTEKRDSYGAVKAALLHVMKGLSHELIEHGVRVNMISPGPVYSKDGIWPLLESEQPGVVKAKIKSIPLGRMGKPEEIANIAVFMCSPRARYIAGSNLVADGGRSSRVPYA